MRLSVTVYSARSEEQIARSEEQGVKSKEEGVWSKEEVERNVGLPRLCKISLLLDELRIINDKEVDFIRRYLIDQYDGRDG